MAQLRRVLLLFFPILLFVPFAAADHAACAEEARPPESAMPAIAGPDLPQKKKAVLGLPELIRMAIEKSPEIETIRQDIRSSQYDVEQAKAGYYPQIETTAVIGPARDAREPLVVNGRITDPSPGLSFSSIGIFGKLDITATQPLYTFGKISNRKAAAEKGVRARQSQLDDKKGQIVLRIKELYYGLVLARSGLATVDEADDFFNDAEGRIKNLLDEDSPNVKDSDLYRVDAYRADILRSKAEAEKGVRLSYFALKALIGMPAGTDFDPADKAISAKEMKLPDLKQFIDSAFANRPEFKQLAEGLAAQNFLVEAAKSDLYPSFFSAAVASFAGAPGRDTLHNQYIPDEFNHAYGGVVAGARWNLDFGISMAKIEKAKAELNKISSQKANAEMSIPIQVSKSYNDMIEAFESVKSYQRAAVSSRKWVITALTGFDMGTETADDMLRAIERYGNNQGKYLESVFRYNMAIAELEYAAGMKTW
ncbi:MAG: TolC family protein [Syntrophaceae bacterium]